MQSQATSRSAEQTDNPSIIHTFAHAEPSAGSCATSLQAFGGYTILRRIGRGGFGQVYLAIEDATWRLVALKVLTKHRRQQQEHLRRFQLEADIGSRLSHSNILPVIHRDVVEGIPFFVMPYVEGADLLDVITHQKLSIPGIVQIAHAITSALEHAHASNILHRDIKPANILIERGTGTPFIADFGLARDISSESIGGGAAVGTQPYMPPEQTDPALGDPSAATDLYALGVTLFQMLTRRTPFPRSDRPERDLRTQIAWDRPEPPSKFNSQVPRDLERICLICLEKSPHDRYASATELREDIERFQRGLPIRARVPSRAKRIYRRCQRQFVETAAIAILLLISGVGALATWHFSSEARTAGEELKTVVPKLEVAEAKKVQAENQSARAEALRRSAQHEQAEQEYRSAIADAAPAWNSGNIGQVADILQRTTPEPNQRDLRGIEWYFWDRRLRTVCLRFLGKPFCRGLALSDDGNVMFVVTDDQATAWSIESNERLFEKPIGPGRREAHLYFVDSNHRQRAAISPDGTLFAATFPGPHGGSVRVWNEAGQPLLSLNNDSRISGHAIVFDPDGEYVVAGGFGDMWVSWNTSTLQEHHHHSVRLFGRESANPHLHPVSVAWFFTDNELHVGGTIWNWGDSNAFRVRVLPNAGARAIVGLSTDLDIQTPPDDVFGVKTNFPLVARPLDSRFNPVCVTLHDKTAVAGCDDRIVREWRIPSYESQTRFNPVEYRGCLSRIDVVAKSNTRVAAACENGTICVWPGGEDPSWSENGLSPDRLVAGTALPPRGTSPSGRFRLAADPDNAQYHLHNASGEVVASFAGPNQRPLHRMSWSQNEQFVAAYSSNQGIGLDFSKIDRTTHSRVYLYDTNEHRCISTIDCPDGASLRSLRFSPNGDVLCISTVTGTSLHRTSDGQQLHQFDINGWVTEFSPEGRYLAIGNDVELRVWEFASSAWYITQNQGATMLKFDPTEQFLFAWQSQDVDHVMITDLLSRDTRQVLRNRALVGSCAFSADGSRLYTYDGSTLSIHSSEHIDGEPLLSERWIHLPMDPELLAKRLDALYSTWRNQHQRSLRP